MYIYISWSRKTAFFSWGHADGVPCTFALQPQCCAEINAQLILRWAAIWAKEPWKNPLDELSTVTVIKFRDDHGIEENSKHGVAAKSAGLVIISPIQRNNSWVQTQFWDKHDGNFSSRPQDLRPWITDLWPLHSPGERHFGRIWLACSLCSQLRLCLVTRSAIVMTIQVR